jgi:hypothetical protein
MFRHRYTIVSTILVVASAVHVGCGPGGAADGVDAAAAADVPADEASFAELQARGHEAMGVDQYTSVHLFDALPDGGRIELQRAVDDPDGVAQIRAHLQEIVRAFESGDFSTPAFVHAQEVPGTAVMAAKRDAITYTYRDLPAGGEVRIVTQDAAAIAAIHAFMEFQRDDHRAGGATHDHGAVGHDHDAAGAAGHEHGAGGQDAGRTTAAQNPAGAGAAAGTMDHAAHMAGGGTMDHAAHMAAGSMDHAAHMAAGGGMDHAAHMAGGGMDHAAHMAGGMGMMGMAGRGMAGGGMGMAGDAAFGADMDLVHELLAAHRAIERTVTHLDDGVRTVTESADPIVVTYIKAHVASMQQRMLEGAEFNVSSPTIPVLFANAERIRTVIEQTPRGIIFTQTTEDPALVPVLQAHAAEVTELVNDGMAAMHRSMMMQGGGAGTPPPAAPGRTGGATPRGVGG